MKPKKKQGRKRKIFISVMLIFRLLFGGTQAASTSSNSEKVQDGVGSKALISRTLSRESSMIANLNQDDCPQSELVSEGTQRIIKTPSGYIISSIQRGGENDLPGKPSKFGPGSKAKGAAKRNFARRQAGKTPTNRQSGGGFFANAFTVEPKFPARPGRNRDGLLGRFSAQPTPDPYNPGCAGRPRSITVLSQSKSSEQDSVREVKAHDGVKAILTDKSTNHLTSKHGHVLGIDDLLPPNPNQKLTKYKQIRTRVNKENKEKFGDIVEEILKDPTTEPYPDVNIRGIKSHGYYTENYGSSGFFVGIHTEGEFAGQIKKAQPISDKQLKTLQEENRID